ANDERGNLLIKTTRKEKVVDVVVKALDSFFFCEPNNSSLPVRFFKIHGFRDVRVPTASDHQMIGLPRGQSTMRFQKITSKNNVAIRITNRSVFRDLLRFSKNRIEAFRAKFGTEHIRLVP